MNGDNAEGEDNAAMHFKIRMQQSLVLHPFGYSVPVLVDALHSSSAVILVNVSFGHINITKNGSCVSTSKNGAVKYPFV